MTTTGQPDERVEITDDLRSDSRDILASEGNLLSMC